MSQPYPDDDDDRFKEGGLLADAVGVGDGAVVAEDVDAADDEAGNVAAEDIEEDVTLDDEGSSVVLDLLAFGVEGAVSGSELAGG